MCLSRASSRFWCIVFLTDGETGVRCESLAGHGVAAVKVASGGHGGEEEEGECGFWRQHFDRCQVDVWLLESVCGCAADSLPLVGVC